MHALITGSWREPLLILAQTEGGGLAGYLPLILIAVAFYFLLIRPQQRRAKAQRQLVQSVSSGDRVVTIGGLHGTVADMDDDTMRLEIAPGTIVTMARSAIARRLVDADEGVVDTDELVADDPTKDDARSDDLEREAEQHKVEQRNKDAE